MLGNATFTMVLSRKATKAPRQQSSTGPSGGPAAGPATPAGPLTGATGDSAMRASFLGDGIGRSVRRRGTAPQRPVLPDRSAHRRRAAGPRPRPSPTGARLTGTP